MHEFDRVFDGEDVLIATVVHVVNHGGKSGALARTRRPRHHYQPSRQIRNISKDLPQAQLLHRQHLGGDGTKHRRRTAVLIEGVHPEARESRHLEGEVCLHELFVVLALFIGHDLVDETMDFLVIHGGDIDLADVSVDSDQGRHAGREMQIRCALFNTETQ